MPQVKLKHKRLSPWILRGGLVEIITCEPPTLMTLFCFYSPPAVDVSKIQLEIYLRARSPVATLAIWGARPFLCPSISTCFHLHYHSTQMRPIYPYCHHICNIYSAPTHSRNSCQQIDSTRIPHFIFKRFISVVFNADGKKGL